MERVIITISENGRVNIPDSNVWMSEMELVELFGVLAPTLRAAIKSIYKSEMLCPAATQRYDVATPTSWATFYNLEVVIALAFRLNTYEASRIRQKVLESLTQRKMEVFNLFFALKSGGNDNFYHIERNN
ncbi:MAG: hypothetical protein J6J26_03715 [Bacteroides sp.]|nr:hypothetical protein [Bacteroides sp.]